MAIERFGQDFWIGRVLRSKDKREDWRHVVVVEMKGSRAKCHNLILGSARKMDSRGTWISYKGLATRWATCRAENCFCSKRADDQSTESAEAKP